MAIRVYLECGSKRVFACAFDWPGWCRSGRDEQRALDALAAAAHRYLPVAAAAGFPFDATGGFEVVERLPGSATTDFGAPEAVASADVAPFEASAARRLADLVAAAWEAFDAVVAVAPTALRKGPRGGGRDRDAIVAHVAAAEAAYGRKLGVRVPPDELRVALLAALRGSRGGPPEPKRWPAAYAARRIAWHALDHAWEIEDRTA